MTTWPSRATRLLAFLSWALCFVPSLQGCASIPKAPDHLDLQAKTAAVPPHLARLYVYRAAGWSYFPRSRSLNDIDVDGRFLGTIERGRYVFTDVAPNTLVVRVKVRRSKHLSVDTSAETTVEVEAGRAHYLRVEPSWIWNHPPRLLLVQVQEGSAQIEECVLASGSHYY